MRTLAAQDLLNAWEQALGQPGPMQTVPVLAAATGDAPGAVARWSIARRDGALFELREHLFGRRAEAVLPCPACAADLEFEIDLGRLRPAARADDEAPAEVTIGGQRIRYRSPNSLDLEAIAGLASADQARAALLARCAEAAGPAADLPGDALAEIAALIDGDQADAEVRLALSCPACGHEWSAPFDIAGFLWREVEEWAWRTLRQVHRLARAYGWTEDEVLALAPRRRQCYLDLLDE